MIQNTQQISADIKYAWSYKMPYSNFSKTLPSDVRFHLGNEQMAQGCWENIKLTNMHTNS